jgi:hypothetical protein
MFSNQQEIIMKTRSIRPNRSAVVRVQRRDAKKRLWKPTLASLLLASALLTPAGGAFAGTSMSGAFEDGAYFETMSDADMSSARGGYRGVSFGVYFTGSVSSSGNTGELPPGMSVMQDGDNRVQLQAALGDLGGANGLFQFTNVVGDMNVVNNSIVINIMVLPDLPSNVAAVLR